ncbi:hypothetical protein [Alistipes ihumii]|uniref:hypothetical protein n=1 Tax=Alistipes ihumii TaxID=1470347 RepID=UPI003AEF5F42
MATFLQFFFSEGIDVYNIERFERECCETGGRADFLIDMRSGERFIIECKIFDQNHHFGQYEKVFGIEPSHLGYITNYSLRQEGYTVHTWEELCNHLQAEIPENEEREMWLGYIAYIKNVCSIIQFNDKMALDTHLYSLYQFMEELKRLVTRQYDQYDLSYYSNRNIDGGYGISGIYFQIHYSNGLLPDTWAWAGIYYERKIPEIWIGFENRNGWGKPMCDAVLPRLADIKGAYVEPLKEDNNLWYKLRSDRFDQFNAAENVELQRLILTEFLDEVLLMPSRF